VLLLPRQRSSAKRQSSSRERSTRSWGSIKNGYFALSSLTGAWLTISGVGGATPAVDAAGQLQTVAVAGLASTAQQTDTLGLGREDHRALLTEELRKAGYTAVDAKAPSIDSDPARPARYVLSGIINEINCVFENSLSCNIAVRWELRDRSSDAVVYRVTTRSRETGKDGNEVSPKLLTGALRSLTARPKLAAKLSVKAGATSSESSPAAEVGFRECTRAAVTMPEASQAILSSTVLIESGDALGSGSILSTDGFVLTAAHVIEPGAPLHVQLSSGPIYEAQLIRRDLKRDVALVQAKGTTFKQCLPLRQDAINVGEEVYAIGSPLSKELSFSLTRGIVSGFRTIDGVPLVQTDASVNPGNSGGPLVDKKGRLLAVVDFKITGQVVQGLAFAVTVPAALEALHLHGATSSDASLSVPLVLAPTQAKVQTAVDDVDDPAQPGDYSVAEVHHTSGTASAFRTVGVLSMSLGLVGVTTSWMVYEVGKSSMNRSTFDTLLTTNSISWAAVGVGAGLFAVSYMIPSGNSPKPAKEKKSVARVYAGVGPGSILVGGEL
jgi:serine protease Do